jgi:BTB/POZ domain
VAAAETPSPAMAPKVEPMVVPMATPDRMSSIVYEVPPLEPKISKVDSPVVVAPKPVVVEKVVITPESPKIQTPAPATVTPKELPAVPKKTEAPVLMTKAEAKAPMVETPSPLVVTPMAEPVFVAPKKVEAPVVVAEAERTVTPKVEVSPPPVPKVERTVTPKVEVSQPPVPKVEPKPANVVAPVVPPEVVSTSVLEAQQEMPTTKKVASIRNFADEFDDILDGAPIATSAEELLGWSLDSTSANMADWKIVVYNEEEEVPVTYHVHRLVLSTGPTKSDFFENIVRNEPTNSTTEVVLSKSAARAYPEFLDFMYSREDLVDVNTVNAAALRYIGKYFGVRKLVALVTTFVRDDLKPNTSLHYLNAAAEFQDEKLMTTASQLCAQNITTSAVDREGLTSLDPPLFSMVVSFPEVACTSEELSKYVAEFARKHVSEMNVALLDVVTDNKNMATIDPCEAVYLLQLSEEYDDKSDLGARCIKSCATAWYGTLVAQVEPSPDDAGSYVKISPPLKVVMLEKALIQAHADWSQVEVNKDAARAEEKQRLMAKDEIIAAKEKTIAEMQDALAQQEDRYAKLMAELARFNRVPCEYEFPRKKDCTFHQSATSSKKSPYGKTKPTKMPVNSTSADLDGYLYGSGVSSLPVYYYQGF